MLTKHQRVRYPRAVLKATVVILLSIILGVGAVMAIRTENKTLVMRAVIAGLAVLLLAIVLRPEKH